MDEFRRRGKYTRLDYSPTSPLTITCQFLTTFILSLMKSIDIRSESAVKLLAEFLDMDDEGRGVYVEGERSVNAEHFAHGAAGLLSVLQLKSDSGLHSTEVYSYLRSPYRDLFVYDSVVQVATFSKFFCLEVNYRLNTLCFI